MDSPNDSDIAIHICPMCKKDIASGKNTRGLPALCAACEEQEQILAARLRLLPEPLRKLVRAREQRRRA
jgi:hypothetical protein